MPKIFKHLVAPFITCISLIFASNTFAVVINFDELIPLHDPVFPCFCDNPLTNEYVDKGLTFTDGYFDGSSSDGGLTYQNHLVTGPYGQIIFSGQLPTFVSMFVTSIHNDAIYLSAYDDNGFLEMKKTPGFGGPFDDTPAEPNFYISFTAEKGIKFINIDAFFFRSTGAEIDNLTFTHASAPEPSSLLLISLLFAPLLRRFFIKR